jgi:hypothetical protein
MMSLAHSRLVVALIPLLVVLAMEEEVVALPYRGEALPKALVQEAVRLVRLTDLMGLLDCSCSLDLLHSLHKNLLILSKAKQQADCKALSKPLIVVLLLSRQTLADTLLAFLQHEGYSLADLGYNCSK